MSQKAVFLMGVSGSGKSTIQPYLLACEDLNLMQVNTVTTRPMRKGETQGEMYDFVSDESFREAIDQNAFVEYALVHQMYYYATPKKAIEDAFARGKNVIKQIDMHGREQILENNNVRHYSRSVFMDVSDETIRGRLVARDPSISEEEILHRLTSARYEREKASSLCDVFVSVDGLSIDEQVALIVDAVVWLLGD